MKQCSTTQKNVQILIEKTLVIDDSSLIKIIAAMPWLFKYKSQFEKD